MTVALFLHLISDVIWIGGMFLAYVAVRPAALEVLERLSACVFGQVFSSASFRGYGLQSF